MQISSEHRREAWEVLSDFSGGLNTSYSQEQIAENELAVCLNMDVDTATGKLKVVDGNVVVLKPEPSLNLYTMFYDRINSCYIGTAKSGEVYTLKGTDINLIGTLTGSLSPVYSLWEDGVLIASGGKLQYYNGSNLATLDNSPSQTVFVTTRQGRVVAVDHSKGNESNIYFSAVGDETSWANDSNDSSSGQWVEIGYKDGGKIVALIPMAQDLLVVKSNRHAFRLVNNFPDWQVLEVSRNIDCVGRTAFFSNGDTAYILGRTELHVLQESAFYGDIKTVNAGVKISDRLVDAAGMDDPKIIYVPSYNQLWIPRSERYMLIYDLTVNAWYERRFNGEAVSDVVDVNGTIYLIRPSTICQVKSRHGYDNGEKMRWRFVAKRFVSNNNYLVKRAEVNIMPFFDNLEEGNFKIGAVMIALPHPYISLRLWHNYSRLYHNRHKIYGTQYRYNLYNTGEEIYENYEPIYHNYHKLYNPSAIHDGLRCIYRNKTVTISGSGAAGVFTLNSISALIAEV